MQYDELWEWFVYPPHYWYLPHPHAYFVFVEEAAAIPEGALADSPDGGSIFSEFPMLKSARTRYRTSGVRTMEILERIDEFEDLTSGKIEEEQRRHRHDSLRAFFEQKPVHRLDIYVGDEDRQKQAIRVALAPGGWSAILLAGSPGPQDRPVLRAPTTPPGIDEYSLEWLRLIIPLPPPIELRLRDIFSLNHIGDADLGLGEGGGGPGRPPPDGDRWQAGETSDQALGGESA